MPEPGLKSSADEDLDYRNNLAEEIAQRQSGVVYVVENKLAPVFRRQARGLGLALLHIGGNDGKKFFARPDEVVHETGKVRPVHD